MNTYTTNQHTYNKETVSNNKETISNNKVWNPILNTKINIVSKEPDNYYIKRDIYIVFHKCIHSWDDVDEYGPSNDIEDLYIYYMVDNQVYEDLWHREDYFDKSEDSKQYYLTTRKNIVTSIDPTYYYTKNGIQFVSSQVKYTRHYIENNISKHIFRYRHDNGILIDEEWAFNSDCNLYYKVTHCCYY